MHRAASITEFFRPNPQSRFVVRVPGGTVGSPDLPKREISETLTWIISKLWQEVVPEGACHGAGSFADSILIRVENKILGLVLCVERPVRVVIHWFPAIEPYFYICASQYMQLLPKELFSGLAYLLQSPNKGKGLFNMALCVFCVIILEKVK